MFDIENTVRDAAAKAVCDLLGIEPKPGVEFLAASIREALLPADLVSAISGLTVAAIYRQMRQGRFPRPLKVTNAARAWRLSEILAWIESLERDEAPSRAASLSNSADARRGKA
jgi:predicted DNA-binding transcriptional regulator AlpA